jgi:nicotinate-nucleotide adenylyltransferase
MKTKNIGILGSAFNPPHLGHKDIIEQVYQDFDEILLIPSFCHAFDKKMEPYQDRLCMANMLAQSFYAEKHQEKKLLRSEDSIICESLTQDFCLSSRRSNRRIASYATVATTQKTGKKTSQNSYIIEPSLLTPIVTSSIERELGRHTDSPVYTFDVLNELEQRYLNASIKPTLNFIIGPDNATDKIWSKFYRGEEIVERWNLTIVRERIPVHSTLVRELIADFPEPKSLLESRLIKYLDKQIAKYIIDRRLYGIEGGL